MMGNSFLTNISDSKTSPAGQSEWLVKAKLEKATIDLKDPTILKQLEMIGLTIEELQLAKSIQPLIAQHIDEIISGFYQTIINVEELRTIILEHSTIERLRTTLEIHLIEMFNGQIDGKFLYKRIRIADVHCRIGLEPKWYMGALQNVQNMLLDIVHRYVEHSEERIRISKVMTKILNFEQQIVLEAYEKANMHQEKSNRNMPN
ncbi:MAG: protoglobin domain-containing protein [Candidatus Pristimantibacillus sp.]